MKHDPVLVAMIAALWPDYTEIRFTPSDWKEVKWPVKNTDGEMFSTDPNAVLVSLEAVPLQPIGGGYWAGQSKETKIVFVTWVEDDDETP